MTCIAGIVRRGLVMIGADSAGTAGFDLSIRADGKLFRTGEFLIGFTSSYRMGQLLRYRLKPPSQPDGTDTHEFMATLFIDSVRECFRAGGYGRKENEVETGGTFLVGYRGRLFRVSDDFQVGEAADGFDAVGCGDRVALGALAILSKNVGLDCGQIIEQALVAAERLNAGVRGPFQILSAERGAS